MSVYHMIIWFFAFSFAGYMLECVVLSIDYHTVVYNRGFGHGPFCIIYGFGAVGACIFLSRFSGSVLKLYFASMMMATLMELVTAYVMIKLFGAFWWDYSKKRLNYRGIICAQSSIAWGFLGVFFFRFLNGFMHRVVGYVPDAFERILAIMLVVFYVLDFLWTMRSELSGDQEDSKEIAGRLKV